MTANIVRLKSYGNSPITVWHIVDCFMATFLNIVGRAKNEAPNNVSAPHNRLAKPKTVNIDCSIEREGGEQC